MNSVDNQLKTAEFWHALPDGMVACELCPHHCHIREGKSGRCRIRVMTGGGLKAAGYGMISSMHVDPVEKKPLYHFHPGSSIYSIGGWGCNLACSFCQNWTISQDFRASSTGSTPENIIGAMRAAGCSLIAYTYNEPLVGYEFVRDCSRLIRTGGGKNVLVTNGYIETRPAAELLPLIDALNIDVKSMSEHFYREHCKASLAPVLRFCVQAVAAGCHVEITHLIIPGCNDDDENLIKLAEWIRKELGPLTPLHLSAYHPDYRMELPPTPRATLLRAREICRQSLTYVYLGNVSIPEGQDTLCPGCGAVLIERSGYETRLAGVEAGHCIRCGRKTDILHTQD